jgi:hypothetical protein
MRAPADFHAVDVTLEGVKMEIGKVLTSVVDQQIVLVRGKLAEVKSIPDGVLFIHVLKAITPVCTNEGRREEGRKKRGTKRGKRGEKGKRGK